MKICAAKKQLLLVRILFEEVSFKASFEGSGGKGCDREQMEENSRFVQQRSKRNDHHAVFFLRWGCENFYHLKKSAET